MVTAATPATPNEIASPRLALSRALSAFVRSEQREIDAPVELEQSVAPRPAPTSLACWSSDDALSAKTTPIPAASTDTLAPVISAIVRGWTELSSFAGPGSDALCRVIGGSTILSSRCGTRGAVGT